MNDCVGAISSDHLVEYKGAHLPPITGLLDPVVLRQALWVISCGMGNVPNARARLTLEMAAEMFGSKELREAAAAGQYRIVAVLIVAEALTARGFESVPLPRSERTAADGS